MKILMVNVVCGIRSTGRICTDIADRLAKQGHTVKIAYGRGEVPVQYKKYAVKIGNDLDVYLHALKGRAMDCAGFGSKCYTEQFIKWVKTYNPDIIHLHNIHGYYLNIDMLFEYLRNCGKRIIWTMHDCWAFTGHCAYFESIDCNKWETGCNHCGKKKDYPKSWFVDNSAKNHKKKEKLFTDIPNLTIAVPCEWMSKQIQKTYLNRYEAVVIRNGIDIRIFKPLKSDLRERLGLEQKKVVLGISAVWEWRKGIKDFVELSGILGEGYRIVLVGITNRQKKNLPKQIITIPRIDQAMELAKYYTMADVYANPTYEDNYPTTNLEAIACGTPVVTYDTGGSGEGAMMYGMTVNRGDIGQLANAIRCTTFIKRDITSIDVEQCIKKYLTLYEVS